MDWTLWPGVAAILPVIGLGLWYLGPRLLRWWRVRNAWRYPTSLPVGFRTGVGVGFDSPGQEPTSPVELLPTTTAVGSFAGPSVPYPTPTNTIRRVSAVPQ